MRKHALGTFGLLLMLLLAKLAPYADAAPQTYLQRARRWLARRGIDGIAAIGWLVDRFPLPAGKAKSEPVFATTRSTSTAFPTPSQSDSAPARS